MQTHRHTDPAETDTVKQSEHGLQLWMTAQKNEIMLLRSSFSPVQIEVIPSFRHSVYPTPDILELFSNNKLVPYHTNSRHIMEYDQSTPELPPVLAKFVMQKHRTNVLDFGCISCVENDYNATHSCVCSIQIMTVRELSFVL